MIKIGERRQKNQEALDKLLAADEFASEETGHLSGLRAEIAAERQISIRRILTTEKWTELQSVRSHRVEQM